jgi:hypothetical protein
LRRATIPRKIRRRKAALLRRTTVVRSFRERGAVGVLAGLGGRRPNLGAAVFQSWIRSAIIAAALSFLASAQAVGQELPVPEGAAAEGPAGVPAEEKIEGKKETALPSRRTERGPKAPPKIEELEALVIEGRIQKPEVFYVIGRSDTRYKGQELRRSFVHKIPESVEGNPF